MAANTTPFLLHVDPNQMDEPPVSNDEFLDSLDSVGVWLRVLPAYDSLERYASSDRSLAQHLSALANIYLLLGAQFEDQAVTLIAFFNLVPQPGFVVGGSLCPDFHSASTRQPPSGLLHSVCPRYAEGRRQIAGERRSQGVLLGCLQKEGC